MYVLIWAAGVVVFYGLSYRRNIGVEDVVVALVAALCWPLLLLGLLALIAVLAAFWAYVWALDLLGLRG